MAVGAELSQFQGSGWVPVAFFSKKLQAPERKYSAFDRELLAMYLSTKHFRHFLEGRPFTIFTDHKPLTFALASAVDRPPRQTRHLSFVAEFTTDVKHIRGPDNIVADTLSRAVAAVSMPLVDFHRMARLQDNFPQELEYLQSPESGITPRRVLHRGTHIWCDVGTGQPRPIVPPPMAKDVFRAIHELSHSGPKPTIRAIGDRFVWRGMRRDIRTWCGQCQPCQTSKIGRHVRAPLAKFPTPDRRFGSLHVDLVGPLPPSEGHQYLFTIVDRYSRWPEAIPLADATTASCATAFIRSWVARFGVPDHIVSDRGAQFTSALWRELHATLGVRHQTTTAYHPQANGLVERFHRHLKGALKARLSGPQWMEELPIAMLGIRAAWREDADTSPAQLLYGTALRLPGEMIPGVPAQEEPQSGFLRGLQRAMRSGPPVPVLHHDDRPAYVPPSLATASAVYVRHDARRLPLQRPYDGPYAVVSRGPKAFVLNINGQQKSVSIDRLKPAQDFSLLQNRTSNTATAPEPAQDIDPDPDPDPHQEAPLPSSTTTRYGRVSRPPERF